MTSTRRRFVRIVPGMNPRPYGLHAIGSLHYLRTGSFIRCSIQIDYDLANENYYT